MGDTLEIFGKEFTGVTGFKAKDNNGNTLIYTRGGSSGGTPAISIVDTTDSHGGTVREITALDISDTTAIASVVQSPYWFYTANGVKTQGTASGGGSPSSTAHTVYFEFSDNTNTTLTIYYDDAFTGSAITATTPSTYSGKTVTLAQLDGVTWYEPSNIPLNTELIDFTKCLQDTTINSSGQEETLQWYWASDYTNIASGMTFSFTCGWWTYMAFYDSSKSFIRAFAVYESGLATQDSQNSNIGHGTLTGSSIPSNAVYVRMSSTANNSNHMSLIRTA